MKKIFLSGFLFLIALIYTSITYAQPVCTPDSLATKPGVYPDSIAGLDTGTVGVAYADVITIVVPTDTIIFSILIVIDSIVLTGIKGLPPGLVYACEPPSCSLPGGSSGCLLISGMPTTAGVYDIVANLDYYIGGSPTPISDSVDYYTIVINPVPNTAPVAIDDSATTDSLQVIIDVQSNDIDPEGDPDRKSVV